MPLIKGKSDKSFSKNVETEMDAGKDQKQSLAIAYQMKREAQKMAQGGEVESPSVEHVETESQKGAEGGEEEKEVHLTMQDSVVDRIMKMRAGESEVESSEIPEEFGVDFTAEGSMDDLDDLGDKDVEKEEQDLVLRIMRARAKMAASE